jgi:amino acid transporter
MLNGVGAIILIHLVSYLHMRLQHRAIFELCGFENYYSLIGLVLSMLIFAVAISVLNLMLKMSKIDKLDEFVYSKKKYYLKAPVIISLFLLMFFFVSLNESSLTCFDVARIGMSLQIYEKKIKHRVKNPFKKQI